MKKIQLTFLSGNIDTTIMLIDSLIANTSPSDKYFNDLMELQSIISQHFIYGNSIDILSIDVTEGWNLICGLSFEISIGQIDDNNLLIPGAVYGFNGGYVNVDLLEPGAGYWVRANDSGSIILTND